jgi:hypothetical protein
MPLASHHDCPRRRPNKLFIVLRGGKATKSLNTGAAGFTRVPGLRRQYRTGTPGWASAAIAPVPLALPVPESPGFRVFGIRPLYEIPAFSWWGGLHFSPGWFAITVVPLALILRLCAGRPQRLACGASPPSGVFSHVLALSGMVKE